MFVSFIYTLLSSEQTFSIERWFKTPVLGIELHFIIDPAYFSSSTTLRVFIYLSRFYFLFVLLPSKQKIIFSTKILSHGEHRNSYFPFVQFEINFRNLQ